MWSGFHVYAPFCIWISYCSILKWCFLRVFVEICRNTWKLFSRLSPVRRRCFCAKSILSLKLMRSVKTEWGWNSKRLFHLKNKFGFSVHGWHDAKQMFNTEVFLFHFGWNFLFCVEYRICAGCPCVYKGLEVHVISLILILVQKLACSQVSSYRTLIVYCPPIVSANQKYIKYTDQMRPHVWHFCQRQFSSSAFFNVSFLFQHHPYRNTSFAWMWSDSSCVHCCWFFVLKKQIISLRNFSCTWLYSGFLYLHFYKVSVSHRFITCHVPECGKVSRVFASAILCYDFRNIKIQRFISLCLELEELKEIIFELTDIATTEILVSSWSE